MDVKPLLLHSTITKADDIIANAMSNSLIMSHRQEVNIQA